MCIRYGTLNDPASNDIDSNTMAGTVQEQHGINTYYFKRGITILHLPEPRNDMRF